VTEAPATSALPVVVLVGRPNVGKSSLFNRLLGQRRAIVDDQPGVTRDRLLGTVVDEDRSYVCVDTGGFDARPPDDDALLAAVREQALGAVRDADCVVLVVDGSAGAAPADVDLARLLRRTGRPLVVAVNKIDVPAHDARLHDFHGLGTMPLVATSAAHGRGLEELRSAIREHLPASDADASGATQATRLALVGRPNVGKSSLLNRLLGVDRVVVSPTAGTTRDAIDTPIRLGGRPFVLVDTAGIRRRGRIRDRLEGHGAVRALGMLTRSDLVTVVLDATEGMTDQDARIVGRALEAGRGVLLAANKWDLLPSGVTLRAVQQRMARQHPGLGRLPVVGVSAKTGRGLADLTKRVLALETAYRRRISTADLNRLLQRAVASTAPPSPEGRPIRFFYATQTGSAPPTFAIFVSAPSRVPAAYVRYLENALRERFGLVGVPITVRLRSRRAEQARPAARPRGGGPRGRRTGTPRKRSRRSPRS